MTFRTNFVNNPELFVYRADPMAMLSIVFRIFGIFMLSIFPLLFFITSFFGTQDSSFFIPKTVEYVFIIESFFFSLVSLPTDNFFVIASVLEFFDSLYFVLWFEYLHTCMSFFLDYTIFVMKLFINYILYMIPTEFFWVPSYVMDDFWFELVISYNLKDVVDFWADSVIGTNCLELFLYNFDTICLVLFAICFFSHSIHGLSHLFLDNACFFPRLRYVPGVWSRLELWLLFIFLLF